MKAYVLVCDWAWDLAPDMDVAVFSNREDAICKMRAESQKFKETESVMSRLTEHEYGDTYCSFSQDGRWQENHIAWTIYERDIPDCFDAILLNREDFKCAGVDTSKCSDAELQGIADKVGEYICEYSGYQDFIFQVSSHKGLPMVDSDDEPEEEHKYVGVELYIRNNVNMFKHRYAVALDNVERLRCSIEYADPSLWDDIVRSASEYSEDMDITITDDDLHEIFG